MSKEVPEQLVHYIEIVTPDVKQMCELFTNSYGWKFQPVNPALGNAYTAELPGGLLYGIRAPLHPAEKPIIRTYLRVNDLNGSVESAAKQGANILLDRMELPGHGVIAIFDLGGIEQGLWQVV